MDNRVSQDSEEKLSYIFRFFCVWMSFITATVVAPLPAVFCRYVIAFAHCKFIHYYTKTTTFIQNFHN